MGRNGYGLGGHQVHVAPVMSIGPYMAIWCGTTIVVPPARYRERQPLGRAISSIPRVKTSIEMDHGMQ
jgi:hypothetical protein